MNKVAKIIDISAASESGFEDAVEQGLHKVADSIDGIRGAWVSDIKVRTDNDGRIREWRVDLRVGFIVY